MQPDTSTPELTELADAAIAAQQAFDAARDTCAQALDAVEQRRSEMKQPMSDLINGLAAAGITLTSFQHAGHLFSDDGDGGFRITQAPPNLANVGVLP